MKATGYQEIQDLEATIKAHELKKIKERTLSCRIYDEKQKQVGRLEVSYHEFCGDTENKDEVVRVTLDDDKWKELERNKSCNLSAHSYNGINGYNRIKIRVVT